MLSEKGILAKRLFTNLTNKINMKTKQQIIGAKIREFAERFVKVPCDCPKGGLIGENETICPKCNGTEWIADKEISEGLSQSLSEIADETLKAVKLEITPEFKDFQDELNWNEKNRGTDSQLYNEGFNEAIEKYDQKKKEFLSTKE